MVRKIILYLGFSLIAVFLQSLVGPWLTIQEIRPDFILLLVILIGQSEGRFAGQLFGFGIGLFVDSIGGGSSFGISIFTKTIGGFLAGFLKHQRTKMNIFTYYAIIFVIFFIHFYIFYSIYYRSLDLSLQFRLVRYILPSILYSGIFYILIDYFFLKHSE